MERPRFLKCASMSFVMYCVFAMSFLAIEATTNITTDQSSLLALKARITNDPYNLLANNWTSSTSVCNWVGITCDSQNNRVVALNLTSMSLTGTVPPHIGNLSFLVQLRLKNNSFHGSLPMELVQLQRLEILHLGYNTFQGEIPSWLGSLPKLQNLSLHLNNFTGQIPRSLFNCTSLRKINLGGNRLTGQIPRSVFNCSSLQELDLSGNRLTVTSMASTRLNMPDSADTYKRFREELSKKRAAAKKKSAVDQSTGGTSAPNEHVYTSSPDPSPKKKRPRKDPPADKGKRVESSARRQMAISRPDSTTAPAPSTDLCSFDEPTKFLEKSFDYILPADEKHLQKKKTEDVFDTTILSAIHALQASLHLHGRYKALNDKCGKQRKMIDVLKLEKAKVDTAAGELKSKNLTLEKELEDMRSERDRHSLELTEARTALAEEQRLVASLKDQVMQVASVALCKAKAELYKEYLAGDHARWNHNEMQEMVETYEEMCRLEELSPGQDEEQALDENQLPQGAGAVDTPLNDLHVIDPPPVDAANVGDSHSTDDASRLDPPVN